MTGIEILESITDPGRPAKENEDRFGWNDRAVFVIDGATSLGDPVLAPSRSDAAWLARRAAEYFTDNLAGERPTAEIVEDLCRALSMEFRRATAGRAIERYRLPTAAFQALRLVGDEIETTGLGDCVLFMRDAGGEAHRRSALHVPRQREQHFARKALDVSGGFDDQGIGYSRAELMEGMRKGRALQNTADGMAWTLGLEPRASRHLATTRLDVRLPATAILCTDGFGDLVDNYAAHTAESLVSTAEADGLAGLIGQLREIERVIDPEGTVYPRYKQSDDASAVLFRLVE